METVLLIPFIPLVISALLSVVKGKESIPRISMFFSAFIAILGLIGAYYVTFHDKNIYGFNDLLVFDQLSAILIVYVAILGMVIRKYAEKYMWDEKGYKRFFILLNFIFTVNL